MAEFPALPLWTDAYLADTRHLSPTEHGAYLIMLITAWRTPGCCLPNDDKYIAKITGLSKTQWTRIKPVILDFWDVRGDKIYQGRLSDEYVLVRRNSKRQSDNARARWLKRNETHNATAMPLECHSDAPFPHPHPSQERITPPPLSGTAAPLKKTTPKSNGKSDGKPKPKATRLDPDWRPSAEHFELGNREGLDAAGVEREADKFRDFWLAKPKDNTKLDWPRTFNNWIRNRDKFGGDRPAGNDSGGNQLGHGSLAAAIRRNLRDG